MLEVEILVAPLLESRVVSCIEPVAGFFQRPVKVNGVLEVRIVRREVRSSSKPAAGAALEKSEVRVNSWDHRIPGM